MKKPRFFIGEFIGQALILSGIARLFLNRRIARGEVTAIYFHNPQQALFEKLMTKAQQWGFEFIDAKRLLDYLSGDTISAKPLLFVSMDDGWRRNLTDVALFAEKNHIPVCYFISTEPMESGEFWWRKVNDGDLIEQLKRVPDSTRRAIIQTHYANSNRDAMTAEEVQALSQMSHATIGNHTHHHPILPMCTLDEVEFELTWAHGRLTELINKKVEFFAYPNGDCDGREQAILARLGYSMAFTVEPRGINKNEENLFRLPRFSDNPHGGLAENFCRLIGLWQTLTGRFGRNSHNDRMEKKVTGPLPIKILQLVPESLPTFRADLIVLFGKYLPKHHIYSHLVGKLSSTGQVQPEFPDANYSRHVNSRLLRELSFLWTCTRSLLRAKKSEYDVIQVRDMVSIGLLALVICRLKGIPFVYWMSFLNSEARIDRALSADRFTFRNYLIYLKGRAEHFFLYRWILPHAQHTFVQSDAMARHVQGKGIRGISADKMTAVPMGVDTEQMIKEHNKSDRPEKWATSPVIAYLGTLIESRNLNSLIDAFCLVRQQCPAALLVLIGNADTQKVNDALLAHARQKGLPEGAVEITGWLPTQAAWKLLLHADVAVSAIPRDAIYDVSSPTKLIEYLAAGIPCVANDNPDQVQVLNQSKAGLLVSSEVSAIANALITVLKDPVAARARAALGPGFIEQNRSYRVLADMVAKRYRRFVPVRLKA